MNGEAQPCESAARTESQPGSRRRWGIKLAEEVIHHVHARIAGMIQARQYESGLDRFQQREVVVACIALRPVRTVVGIHHEEDLVYRGRNAVVVFVPQNNNGVLALFPDRRRFDRGDNLAQSHIALLQEGRVEPCLGPVVIRIKVAEGAGISAAVLIVTLVRHDKREVRNVTAGKVAVEAVASIERHYVVQVAARHVGFLDAAEVDEWIVLRGIEVNEVTRGQRRSENRLDVREVGAIGEEAVAEI